jgi:hypothetical protein
MRSRYLFLMLFVSASSFSAEQDLRKILDRSVFGQASPPRSLAEGKLTQYNPIVVSVVASLKSRLPKREDDGIEILLPPGKQSTICPHPITAHLTPSKSGSPYTFVILPGSYATWTRGSFSNQTAAVLREKFNDPNILSFAGYLGPEFLEGTCKEIPWDGISIAKDFYSRIGIYLQSVNADPARTGVVGFSGGGFLTSAMLAHDANAVRSGAPRVFGLGGMSFSPILHGRTAFNNLDTRYRGSKIDRSLGLTTRDISNSWYMVKIWIKSRSFDPPTWSDIADFSQEDPETFVDRAFNEFTVSDLVDTLKAVKFDLSRILGELSYYNVYVRTGFAMSQKSLPENLDRAFDEATSVDSIYAAIDRPLLIYFSQDDPVLSSHDGSGQPQVITDILARASKNPNIVVFNPRFGAHTGALLDPIFSELFPAVFGGRRIDSPQLLK